jgi:aryl-alcohol dehydrogenase-like predicted oxidoreductase
MDTRALGTQGLVVPAIGLGCMGMTAFYSGFDKNASTETSLAAIDAALEAGANFLDSSWIYQDFGGTAMTNEELIGKAIEKHGRSKFIIGTKWMGDGKKETIDKQLGDSLSRLGTDYIDLYYMHRMDPDTPIEETMAVLKEYVAKGTIKYVGLSECTAEELRRAHSVQPISAIQMEWSLQSRDLEEKVVPAARELGVGIVAYSPMARGVLSNKFQSYADVPENDWRRQQPRFQTEENFNVSMAPLKEFFAEAEKRNVTPAQLALAWVLAQGSDVVPIPGAKTPERVKENCAAVSVKLSTEDAATLTEIVKHVDFDRYAGGYKVFNERQ